MDQSGETALIEEIRSAFPDPGWPADVMASKDASGDLDCIYVRNHCQGRRWQDLTDEELRFIGMDAWALSPDAFAYFLPAWLERVIARDRPGQGRGLFPHIFDDHAEHLANVFTDPQRQLVLKLLLSWHEQRGDPSPDKLIDRLLALEDLTDIRDQAPEYWESD